MYIRHYDDRFGDMYEIYLNDQTQEFEGALRSVEAIGMKPIYYEQLKDIPPVQRNAIEHAISIACQQKQQDPTK